MNGNTISYVRELISFSVTDSIVQKESPNPTSQLHV